MRIGIVNDSAMARETLRRVVASEPGLEVAWTAVDGADGVAKVRADPPDLVLMDLFMPGMDGVESTRRIMIEAPCPILIVTATVSGQIDKVYKAMGFGALDAVDTPVIGTAGGMAGGGPLLRKIEVIGKLTGKYQPPPAAAVRPPRGWSSGHEPLLLISASTGGPFAVAEILAALPDSWSVCTIVVQHVDAGFAHALVDALGDAEAAGGVFAVGDDPVRLQWGLPGPDGGHHRLTAGLADRVAEEHQAHAASRLGRHQR